MQQEISIEECFRILELEPCASLEEVKESWRMLSQIWHPDKHTPGSKVYIFAERRQLLINCAYDRLKQCLTNGFEFRFPHAEPMESGSGSPMRSGEYAKPGNSTRVGSPVKQCQTPFCANKGRAEHKSMSVAEFSNYMQKAKAGDPESQYQVGMALELGLAGAADLTAAAHWYERAIKMNNHPPAMHRLGFLYLYGLGVPEDVEQGLRLWKSAAARNNQDAQMDLGLAFEIGEKARESAEEARRWYVMASKNGSELAAKKLSSLPIKSTIKRTT